MLGNKDKRKKCPYATAVQILDCILFNPSRFTNKKKDSDHNK